MLARLRYDSASAHPEGRLCSTAHSHVVSGLFPVLVHILPHVLCFGFGHWSGLGSVEWLNVSANPVTRWANSAARLSSS